MDINFPMGKVRIDIVYGLENGELKGCHVQITNILRIILENS